MYVCMYVQVYVCFTDFSNLCILHFVVLEYVSINLDQKRPLLVRSSLAYGI